MAPNNLTEHLLNLLPTSLSAATTHPFLKYAGLGTLPSSKLCKWLVQDKYYQFAYVNFIGRLIAKLDLTTYAFPTEGGEENLQWKTLQVLMSALEAIKGEIDFYNKTVDGYGLELEREGEDSVTRKYRELFEESSAESKPVVWGLVVLWGTEVVYLKAWSYAKSQQSPNANLGEKGAIAALHKEFIPNWTSSDFKGAVDALAEVANAWATGPEQGEEGNCEKLWHRALALERDFWPGV